MPGPCKDQKELRNRIVGLGGGSLRKSYYPQLQKQIKELKIAKERAEENEKKFSLIFNSASDGMFLVDTITGAIVLSNTTAHKMFDYLPDGLNQPALDSIVKPLEGGAIMARLLSTSSSERPALRSIAMGLNSSKPMICDISSSLVEMEGKIYILARILDITKLATIEKEKEEIKAKLVHASKMEALGRLAGGIAHDFNNILSGIFAYAQLASAHISNPEKAKQDIQQIRNAAEKATGLIQQIMTFTRKSGQEKKILPIFSIVKEAFSLFKSSLPANIGIVDAIRSRALVSADPTNIHQVVMNLCTNACHAMENTGGTLTVELEEKDVTENKDAHAIIAPGNYLELTVSDTGCGMDSSTHDRIFEPYFTTKKSGQGTGLGLALVHGIVEDHKGYIVVKSEPGKGSSFHVFFPIVDQTATSS